MLIDDSCIGCGQCLAFCPMHAISLVMEQAVVDQDACVECSVCRRSKVCPVDAIIEPELQWPRTIRKVFSDPLATHLTGVPGRGTEEMKTNDVTGRYRVGEAGFALDIGRPGIGARLRDVEKIYKRLVGSGVEFEERNPVRDLLKDKNGTDFKAEVLDEKVLSAIIEFKVSTESVPDILKVLEVCAAESDTVFSVGLIDRAAADGSLKNCQTARRLGYFVSPNAKVCVGIGKPAAAISSLTLSEV